MKRPRSLCVEPRPHLLIKNNRAKMMAAMPLSWDPQDAGVKPARCELVGFVMLTGAHCNRIP